MEIQEIDVFIEQDGTVKIEVRGVKGKKCISLTEDIEKALGGQIEEREYTPDYYQEEHIVISESSRIKEGR